MKLKRLFIVLLLACAIGSVSPAFGEGDALRCRFYFPAGSSSMNLYYRNNGTRLEKLMYDIRCRQERSELRRIILRSGASPEGNSFTNKALSDKRLMALRAVICERLFVSDSVFVKSYRSKNGTNEGVEWTTKFSVDSCKTWADTVPSWLDGFDTKSNASTATFNIRACNWEYVSGGPHHNAMAARTQKGTASNPYNLANSTGAATIENTANCYIVDALGYYSFPLVYGNAIKNSVTNEKAYKPGTKTFNSDTANVMATFVNHLNAGITSPYIANNAGCVPYKASVIWQEGDSLIGDVKYVDDGNVGKITFSVAKEYICQGNAKYCNTEQG